MSYRREAGRRKTEKFHRLGISLRVSEVHALDRIRKKLDTSRSEAIGRCIVQEDERAGSAEPNRKDPP